MDMYSLWTRVSSSIVCSLIVLLAFPVLSAHGQNPEDQKRRLPQLGEHVFLPGFQPADPFVTSFVRTGTGAGTALDLIVPVYDLEGEEIGRLEGDIAFILVDFDLQFAITDWLSVRGVLSGLTRIGIDEQAVLAEGLNAVGGYELGAKARIWHNNNFIVSGLLRYRKNGLVGVSPARFVQKVIDSGLGETGSNELIATNSAERGVAGIHAGFSPNKWVGFTALVETGVGDPFGKGREIENTLNVGGSVSVDLGAGTRVPIGVLLFLERDSFSEGASDLASQITTFGWGLFYTGKKEMKVGIESQSMGLKQATGDDLNATMARIVLQYYF